MLKELLKREHLILDMKARTKDEALEELVSVLNFPPDKKRLLLDTLKKREAIGSTGIGRGIAIPHARSVVLDRVYLVVGRSKEGVDFDALDGKPVHLFFMLAAPPQDPGTQYLLALGKVAALARKLAKTKEYLEIDDPDEFINYLIKLSEEE